MAQGTEVVIYEDGEGSGVYLDGKLQRVGDTYLADEWVRGHFGVVTILSSDYMRGDDSPHDAAQTLDEVRAYTYEREAREQRAADLRAQAERLRAEADALDAGVSR